MAVTSLPNFNVSFCIDTSLLRLLTWLVLEASHNPIQLRRSLGPISCGCSMLEDTMEKHWISVDARLACIIYRTVA